MSLHFIIDGYNLINQRQSLLNKPSLEESRAALVRFIILHQPQGKSSNSVTVIFDGKEGVYSLKENISGVKVIFTRNITADEAIKSLVSKSANPRSIVVVTDDRDIQFCVKEHGAEVLSTVEFLSKSKINKKIKSEREASKKDSHKYYLGPSEAAKITEELKNIWLKPR